MYHIIPKAELPHNGNAYLFQGKEHSDVPITFFWLATLPGGGPGLHRHPYQEVFVLQHGQVTFTVGNEQIEVHAETTVIVLANTPHKFINSGNEPIQMVSIHASKELIQEILEEN